MIKKTSPIFVLTDIHGCADELNLLLKKLPITDDSTFIFLGDYVDRGPNSKQVIDTILELKQKYQVVTLMGNHEQLFIEFLKDEKSEKAGMFIYNGGSTTLSSYSTDALSYTIPDEHLMFLAEDLLLMYQTEEYVFVHAGLPNIPLKNIDPLKYTAELLWIRDSFLASNFDWGKTVVHGHTPYEMASIESNRINIDTGCVFNNKLTALQLPEKRLYNVERRSTATPRYLQDPLTRTTHRFIGKIPIKMSPHGELNIFNFSTIDYNEFGMLVQTTERELHELFIDDTDISGTIGNLEYNDMAFSGFIVRQVLKQDELQLAIKFTRPPYTKQDTLKSKHK